MGWELPDWLRSVKSGILRYFIITLELPNSPRLSRRGRFPDADMLGNAPQQTKAPTIFVPFVQI